MPALQKTLVDRTRTPISSASVAILTAGGQPASIYTLVDGEKGELLPTNIATTGDDGQVEVWLEHGIYTLIVSKLGSPDITFTGVVVGFGEDAGHVAMLSDDQILQSPVGVPTVVNDGVFGRVLVDDLGSMMSLDSQPTASAPDLGDRLGSVLAALSDGLRDLVGTVNQITVEFSGDGTTCTLSLPQDINTGADVTFHKVTTTTSVITPRLNTKKIGGISAAPTVTLGPGAGTGATLDGVYGSDMMLRVDFTTGSSPTTAATVFSVQFAESYGSLPPMVMLVAHNRRACSAQSTANTAVAVDLANTTGSTAVFASSTTALTAAVQYSYIMLFSVRPSA